MVEQARQAGAALLVTSGAAITGLGALPAGFRPSPEIDCSGEVRAVAQHTAGLVAVVGVGVPGSAQSPSFVVIANGRLLDPAPGVFEVEGRRVRVTDAASIEDAGRVGPSPGLTSDLVVAVAADPYRPGVHASRELAIGRLAHRLRAAVVVANTVGAAAGHAYDGASFIVDREGGVAQRLPAWHSVLALARFDRDPRRVRGEHLEGDAYHVYAALQRLLSTDVERGRYQGALIGFDAAPESLVCLAAALDVLGAARVAVAFDVRRQSTARLSAWLQAFRAMGVHCDALDVAPVATALANAARSARGARAAARGGRRHGSSRGAGQAARRGTAIAWQAAVQAAAEATNLLPIVAGRGAEGTAAGAPAAAWAAGLLQTLAPADVRAVAEFRLGLGGLPPLRLFGAGTGRQAAVVAARHVR